jgi:hypothetical protein
MTLRDIIICLFIIFLSFLGSLSLCNFADSLKKDMDNKLDAEYVKGFNDALDCRALLSSPMCEMILEKAGK